MPPIANASDLLVLLQAPSKQSVDTFFSFAFSSRERTPDASLLAEVAAQFSCTPAQAERLYRAAAALIREAMAAEVTAESAAALFPADFHADLRALGIPKLAQVAHALANEEGGERARAQQRGVGHLQVAATVRAYALAFQITSRSSLGLAPRRPSRGRVSATQLTFSTRLRQVASSRHVDCSADMG